MQAAGVDVRISDVSAAIEEAMTSHEIEIDGKTMRVKPVRIHSTLSLLIKLRF